MTFNDMLSILSKNVVNLKEGWAKVHMPSFANKMKVFIIISNH